MQVLSKDEIKLNFEDLTAVIVQNCGLSYNFVFVVSQERENLLLHGTG
jgi:hypothetical protein